LIGVNDGVGKIEIEVEVGVVEK